MEKFQFKKPSTFLPIIFLFILTFPLQSSANQPIKTIVVLVMENRSFDHMLGWLKKSINTTINGLNGTECNPISTKDPKSKTICVSDDAQYVDPDPDHSYQGTKQQVFGSSPTPTMTGFVENALTVDQNVSETVMKGFNPNSIPVYTSLASQFAVFDRWFAGLPGPTQPNRLFVYSATSYGMVSNNKTLLRKGFPQKTVFDSVHENNLDFGIYFQNVPTTLFFRNLRKLKFVFKFHDYDLKFKKDAEKGNLPSLTVIEPRYFDLKVLPANDDHPSHDIANGQKLVKEVYETLRSSPQWNETLLVITYDEHGGFYDHVVTPYSNVPSPDGIVSPAPWFFNFDRLGVRIPTIMISPWIQKGTVISNPSGPTANSEFEHSSIPATIKKMFSLSSDFLNKRDAWAGTFEQVVSQLTSPRTDCPETLPDPLPLRTTEADEGARLSEFQSELVELAAALNGEIDLKGFWDEIKHMTVKKANTFVKKSVLKFLRAGKEALMKGADGDSILEMRTSRATRTNSP